MIPHYSHAQGSEETQTAADVIQSGWLTQGALAGGTELLLDVLEDTPNINLSHASDSTQNIIIAPHLYDLPVDLPKSGHMPVICRSLKTKAIVPLDDQELLGGAAI